MSDILNKHLTDFLDQEDELFHYGILGMKWGVRRFQNKDGSLTPAGRKRLKKQITKYAKYQYDSRSKRAKKAEMKLLKNPAMKDSVDKIRKKYSDYKNIKNELLKKREEYFNDEKYRKDRLIDFNSECDLQIKWAKENGDKDAVNMLENSRKEVNKIGDTLKYYEDPDNFYIITKDSMFYRHYVRRDKNANKLYQKEDKEWKSYCDMVDKEAHKMSLKIDGPFEIYDYDENGNKVYLSDKKSQDLARAVDFEYPLSNALVTFTEREYIKEKKSK